MSHLYIHENFVRIQLLVNKDKCADKKLSLQRQHRRQRDPHQEQYAPHPLCGENKNAKQRWKIYFHDYIQRTCISSDTMTKTSVKFYKWHKRVGQVAHTRYALQVSLYIESTELEKMTKLKNAKKVREKKKYF